MGGLSSIRFQLASTTAAPNCSSTSLSSGDSIRFAFGDTTTPANFCPTWSSRISPRRTSFLPEQRLASQCPRSQHAALKEGLLRTLLEPFSSSEVCWWRGGPRFRGALVYFLPCLKSFLWRTIVGWTRTVGRKKRILCCAVTSWSEGSIFCGYVVCWIVL